MQKPIIIPPAETPERTTFNNTVVGTICPDTGKTRCLTCFDPSNDPYASRIYGINIAPYSLVCHICGTLIIDGSKKADGTPLDLYEKGNEGCHYCGGACPSDPDHSCDGYQGDLDNVYPS